MSEATPTSGAATASTARPKRSRWVWLGPLLVVVTVVVGWAGWMAWNDYRFEKERTETPPHVVEDLKLKLLWIPAGTFTMGTEDEAGWLKSLKKKYNEVKPAGWGEWKERAVNSEEIPATVVTLTKGFYLGETEVTQAQWEAVMGSNPSQFKGPNRQVENVSWFDCVEFCRKLMERERAAGRLWAKQVFRLPTEAEWEYACRAGSAGEWSFGDEETRLGEFAWFVANSRGEHREVGMKQNNAWGLYDMHGNLLERCVDVYGTYPSAFVGDPSATLPGATRVIRGGNWGYQARGCRSACRGGSQPDGRYHSLGFRLALSSTP